MMKIPQIDFIGIRKPCLIVSGLLMVVGLVAFLFFPENKKYGLDFSGGTMLDIKFERPIGTKELEDIRKGLENKGIKATLQQIGKGEELIIKLKGTEDEKTSGVIKKILEEKTKKFSWSSTYVGPSVSKNLKSSALKSILLGCLCMLIYIAIRFEFRWAVAAIIALIHDVLITVGLYLLTGREFNTPTVAAFLTLIGFSMNDTIVIFDRIRENLKLTRKEDYGVVINSSINQTLTRTIITSLTVLFTAGALYIFGGGEVADFAFVMTFGVFIGVYSTVFIASPIIYEWHIRSKVK
ncbi:protein translocase subunit SecF [bacterium]|nr:protein translocase subunit SecF [bacterium]MBU2461736.1 protein translocase subunit SecF [bacterium]